MRRSSLLSGAVSLALMGACATSPQPPTGALASATSSPLAIPSPTVPFVRCDTTNLEMQLIFVGAGLGNVGALIEVRNKSTRDCDLRGYAGLQLLDAVGRPVQQSVVWSDTSYIFGANQVEDVIGLPAGTVR